MKKKENICSIKVVRYVRNNPDYHMIRTAPRAISLKNYTKKVPV